MEQVVAIKVLEGMRGIDKLNELLADGYTVQETRDVSCNGTLHTIIYHLSK